MDKQIAQNVEHTDNYGVYQDEIYRTGLLHQRFPVVTMDPNNLQAQAKSILAPGPYNYVSGGAGERATMDANRLAFRQWKIVPRFLRPAIEKDLKVELFGKTYGLFSTMRYEEHSLMLCLKTHQFLWRRLVYKRSFTRIRK
jgi:lactate 2-monooxygenase